MRRDGTDGEESRAYDKTASDRVETDPHGATRRQNQNLISNQNLQTDRQTVNRESALKLMTLN